MSSNTHYTSLQMQPLTSATASAEATGSYQMGGEGYGYGYEKPSRPSWEPQREEAKATKLEKIYMGIECILVFAIGFSYFGLIQANIPLYNAKTRTAPVYIAVFIFAQVYSLIYVYDALRLRNVVQLVLHLWLNTCILIYSIVQIPQTKDTINSLGDRPCNNFIRCSGPNSLENTIIPLISLMPVVIGLCTIAFVVLIKKLYEQFGWASFHLVGASPMMKRIHREYQTLISLLKMLVYFGLAFCVAYLILVLNYRNNTAEFVITILALPIMLGGTVAMAFAARKEIRSYDISTGVRRWADERLMIAMLCLSVVGLAYFIYKLSSMFVEATEYLYSNTKITMAVFAVFAIVILMLTFGFGCIVYSNFGKGLREVHENPEAKTSLWRPEVPTRFSEKGQATEEEPRNWGKDPQSRNALVID